MNRKIAQIGALIESAAVALFAAFLLLDFPFGSYFVCMFLPIGYILTVAGFFAECDPERRTAACAGLVFAAVYAVLIFLVYFAQTTAVRLSSLNDQALTVLDFQRGGLWFLGKSLFLSRQVFVDFLRSLLARAHGEDHGRRAGHGVSARVHAGNGGRKRS